MKTPGCGPLTPEAAECPPPADARREEILDDHSDEPLVDDPFVTFTEWDEPVDEADYAGL